jgi:hypothetical protein
MGVIASNGNISRGSHIHIVMDLFKALPGNSSINSPKQARRQQYGRSVFYVVRPATVDFYR